MEILNKANQFNFFFSCDFFLISDFEKPPSRDLSAIEIEIPAPRSHPSGLPVASENMCRFECEGNEAPRRSIETDGTIFLLKQNAMIFNCMTNVTYRVDLALSTFK